MSLSKFEIGSEPFPCAQPTSLSKYHVMAEQIYPMLLSVGTLRRRMLSVVTVCDPNESEQCMARAPIADVLCGVPFNVL